MERYQVMCGTDEGGAIYADGPQVRGSSATEAGALALAIGFEGRAPQVRDLQAPGWIAMLSRTCADPDGPDAEFELGWIDCGEAAQ